jgi:deoxyribodipyrimidine photolyase-related protein
MTPPSATTRVRTLVLVLGDQLDAEAAAFDGFDPAQDAVWMAEAAEESTHVWSGKQRVAIFLAAMRHFALALRAAGKPLYYTRLDEPGNRGTLAAELQAALSTLTPQRVVMTAPGDWRVWQSLKAVVESAGLTLEVREDRHFFTSVREFAAHAKGRKSLRLEYFYRELRKRHKVLMQDGEPIGGRWNFDADNRETFGADGPGALPPRAAACRLRSRCDHAGRHRAGRAPFRAAPRHAGQLRLAGHACAGIAGAGTLHRRAPAIVRAL